MLFIFSALLDKDYTRYIYIYLLYGQGTGITNNLYYGNNSLNYGIETLRSQ